MTKDEALALALHALHTKGEHHPRVYESIYAIQTVLAQPPLLEQEPTPWRDMVVATLVREGINKHKARELADHFAAQPEQEPVAVAYLCENGVGHRYFRWKKPSDSYKPIALYTAPPAAQRPWQGLTEFQFAEIYNKWNDTNGSTPWGLNQALEAKLKELNK